MIILMALGYSYSNAYGNGYDYGTPSMFHRVKNIGRDPIGVENYPRRDWGTKNFVL